MIVLSACSGETPLSFEDLSKNNSNNTEGPTIENPNIEAKSPLFKSAEEYGVLPFGCETLVKFQFADRWKIIDRSGTVNMGFNINHKALLEINSCLQGINHVKPGEAPLIKKTETIRPAKTTVLSCNDDIKTDSIRIRLPNVGPYEAYYAYNNFYANRPNDAVVTPQDCMEYGNLLLIEPKSRATKIINLYLMKEGKDQLELRLFYIDEQANIFIKELRCDQVECFVTQSYKMEITQKGDIKVAY